MGDYTKNYLDGIAQIAHAVDVTAIEAMADTLQNVRDRGGRIFFLGVGGGAGHASHAVNDFRKIGGFECYAPTDNVSELTARINDEGWDSCFAAWLRGSRLNDRDAVFVFSVGGGNEEKRVSVNIVHAVKYADEVGAAVLAVVGRDGGYTAEKATACLVVPTIQDDMVTTHTESYQAVIWHLLVGHPRLKLNEMKWESVR